MPRGRARKLTAVNRRPTRAPRATSGGLRRLRRPAVALTLVALLLAAGAGTVSAHTRLLETRPADRTVASEAPERLTLVFAEAVDPRRVQLDVLTPDGETVPGASLLTAVGADTAVVEFALPRLADGVYGLSWVTVGPDGHRVAGEVVLGVGVVDSGAVASADFARTQPLDRALEALSGAARYVWYVGLAAVAGAMLVGAWHLRSGRSRSVASGVMVATAGRSLRVGSLLLHAAVVVRTCAIVALVARGYRDGPLLERLRSAVVDGTGPTLLVAVIGTGLLAIWARRRARAASAGTLLQAGLGLLALIALGTASGHAATLAEGRFGIWIAALHTAAASVWLGPLVIAIWASATPAMRRRPAGERSAALAQLFNRFVPVATGAFVVLLLTGAWSTWRLAGRELLSGSGYTTALLVKLALVGAVVVPLGLHHDRRLGWLARGRRRRGRPALGVRSRTLRLEAWALGAVLAVAALLAGMNPAILGDERNQTPLATADSGAAALLSDEPPRSAEECAARLVGRANCYRDYFAAIMRNEGADVAVAEIDALSRIDERIARDCHQIVHDLGNDAVVWYGDAGTALTYEGTACWSGYYHGVVEQAISRLSDDELAGELPRFCATPATDEYSFSHFNCVHGLGHGIMQILGGDVFGTIPYCETLPDHWEQGACMNGALMENVISGQQGNPTDLRTDDLVYPCNAVPDVYVADCFATQTSWMLDQTSYGPEGFAAVFAICDGVRADMIDDCYRALGRDIGSVHKQDPTPIVQLCSLGDPDLWADCYAGAATNAVFNDHDLVAATAICESIRERLRRACFDARDRVAATL